MNTNLRLAFLTTAMAAISTLAAAKPAPAPAPAPAPLQIGTDVGSFSFSGAGDETFYVTLAPGSYVITGSLLGVPTDRGNGYNVNSATLKSGAAPDDAFEQSGRNDYTEDPYAFTVVTTTNLFLDVVANLNTHNNTGTYQGTLTVTGTPLASAVPEPATTALLLAGLGVLGISARRCRA
jgi:PEP-CTERM motif